VRGKIHRKVLDSERFNFFDVRIIWSDGSNMRPPALQTEYEIAPEDVYVPGSIVKNSYAHTESNFVWLPSKNRLCFGGGEQTPQKTNRREQIIVC
jgi:hypothetical protein